MVSASSIYGEWIFGQIGQYRIFHFYVYNGKSKSKFETFRDYYHNVGHLLIATFLWKLCIFDTDFK
jgi:hypothetical protein